MKYFPFVFIGCGLTECTQIITDHEGRFPLSFFVQHETIPGFGTLRLSTVSDTFFGEDYPTRRRSSFQPDIFISLGDSDPHTFRMPQPFYAFDRPLLPQANQHVDLGATPESSFSRSVSSFLISPISNTRKIISINPTNPNQFAFENQLFYARNSINEDWSGLVGHRDLWGLNTTIRFASENLEANLDADLPFFPCFMSDRDVPQISVPSRVIREFISIVNERGIRATRQQHPPHRISLHDVNETTIASLPSLQYIVETENGQHVSFRDLEPHEYLVRSTDRQNTWDVLLHLTAIRNFCEFNSKLLKPMVLHFDTQNRRIGFGEPLVEF